jgi:hypothetical protein
MNDTTAMLARDAISGIESAPIRYAEEQANYM